MGYRIVVVDDDSSIRELLEVNLRYKGYEVTSAADGKEALSVLKSAPPDLVILDVMMPEIDGWELCKIIRDDHQFKNTKIVMLTAKGQDKDKMIGKEILKADEYITKPFDMGGLMMTIQTMLGETGTVK